MTPEQQVEREWFDQAIWLLQEARDFPEATTPHEHQLRAEERYNLVHRASEMIVLEIVDLVRSE